MWWNHVKNKGVHWTCAWNLYGCPLYSLFSSFHSQDTPGFSSGLVLENLSLEAPHQFPPPLMSCFFQGISSFTPCICYGSQGNFIANLMFSSTLPKATFSRAEKWICYHYQYSYISFEILYKYTFSKIVVDIYLVASYTLQSYFLLSTSTSSMLSSCTIPGTSPLSSSLVLDTISRSVPSKPNYKLLEACLAILLPKPYSVVVQLGTFSLC